MTDTGDVSGARSPRAPLGLAVPAALGVAFLALPLVGLVSRTPWDRLPELLTAPVATDALRLSLVTATLATALAAVVGIPLAWFLARRSGGWVAVVRGLVLLPLVLPPVVGGAALLFAFGRTGVLGGPLERATGIVLPFSTAGVVVAEAFVALPFLVIAVEAGLRGAGGRLDLVAASLGARPWTVFRRVTLPVVAPALAAGTALAWARALGEFGATITFAGNLPGSTQTLPLAVYVTLQDDRDAAVALSLVLVAVAVAVIVALRGRWRGAA